MGTARAPLPAISCVPPSQPDRQNIDFEAPGSVSVTLVSGVIGSLTRAPGHCRIAGDAVRSVCRCRVGCMDYRYEQNEAGYQRLQKRAGRAVDYAVRSFEDFDLRSFLEAVLPPMTLSGARPRAFEYGTGTGPGACFLAARGFVVDAVDISPTAIALARRFADQRRLTVSFAVCDIRSMTPPGPLYNLVVDNFCLQWLVADNERRRVLAMARSLLKLGGNFLVGTVPYRAGRDFGTDRFDPSTGIVHRRLPGRSRPMRGGRAHRGGMVGTVATTRVEPGVVAGRVGTSRVSRDASGRRPLPVCPERRAAGRLRRRRADRGGAVIP